MPVDKPSWKTPLFAMKLAAVVLIGIILIAIYIKTNNLNPSSKSINLGATNYRLKSEVNKSKQIKNYRIIELTDSYIDQKDLSEILQHSDKKTSLIFFWATWCPNCKEQLLNLAKVQNKFPKKLKVIAINIDEKKSSKEVSAYWSNLELQMPLILDSTKKTLSVFKIDILPTAVLLSKKRQYLLKIDGPINWDDIDLKNKIQSYL